MPLKILVKIFFLIELIATLNMENNDFGTLLNALKAIDAESTHVLNRGLATKTFFLV